LRQPIANPAAFQGPVEITRHSKHRLVLLTAEDYERLVRATDTRRSFHADDAPDGVAAMMLAAFVKAQKKGTACGTNF
jgi:hypothetical protein